MLNDYTSISPADVTDVTESAITAAEALVDRAAAAKTLTWDTTMALLEEAGALVADAYGKGPFLARVHPDKEVQTRAVLLEERLQKWSTDIAFRRDLYETVKAYADGEDAASLSPIRRRLVDHWMRDFRRAGHELDDAARASLQEKQLRLIELQVEFSKNLDEWDDGIDVTEAELAGMSADYIGRLAPGTTPGTYRISMAYPDYVPFLEQGSNRDLRRRPSKPLRFVRKWRRFSVTRRGRTTRWRPRWPPTRPTSRNSMPVSGRASRRRPPLNSTRWPS